MVTEEYFKLLRRKFSLVLERSLFACVLIFIITQILVVSFFSNDSETVSVKANVTILRHYMVRNKMDRQKVQCNETFCHHGNKNSITRKIQVAVHPTNQGSITYPRFREGSVKLPFGRWKPNCKGISVKRLKLAKGNMTDLKTRIEVYKSRPIRTASSTERHGQPGRIFGNSVGSQKITLSAENLCKSKGSEVIILVTSALNNFEERDAIRKTWGSSRVKNRVEYIFVLGLNKSGRIGERIYRELFDFSDVLIGSFIDSYRNLTLKTVFGLNWILEHCSGVQFIMKTDDDVFINVPNLLYFLENNTKLLDNGMAGFCMKSEKPIRDKDSKWFVSVEEYPWEKYPEFCSGIGYVTSKTVVQKILDVAESVNYFHLEDVYVGICLNKLGIAIHNIPQFYQKRPPSIPCFYKRSDVILIHNVTSVLLQRIWNAPCDIKFLHSQRYKELLHKIRETNKLV